MIFIFTQDEDKLIKKKPKTLELRILTYLHFYLESKPRGIGVIFSDLTSLINIISFINRIFPKQNPNIDYHRTRTPQTYLVVSGVHNLYSCLVV